jgi:O-antigen biosynthesis protein
MLRKTIVQTDATRDTTYSYWLYQNRLSGDDLLKIKKENEAFSYKPKISIITPVYNVDEKFLRLAIESIINQVYSNWELCLADDASTKSTIKKILQEYSSKDSRIKVKYLEKNQGIAGASNQAFSLCTGDYVGFMDDDDELYVNTLFEVVKLINQDRTLDLIYTDDDKIDLEGYRIEPYFKPDWSPDLLLSFGYINHFTVYRKSLLDELNGLRLGLDGSQDYDLLLRATEKTNKIGHIPKPLYGWRKIPGSTAGDNRAKDYAHDAAARALRDALIRRGIEGDVIRLPLPGLFRIKYELEKKSLITIIIVTHDKPKLLRNLLGSIETKTNYRNYEILVIDRKSEEKETLDYLKTLKHKVIRYEEGLNYSKVVNFATKFASGVHLLFMNDDMEVINSDWLETLLEHSQRREVGVVGNLLLYPKDKNSNLGGFIQHAGLVLGSRNPVGHVFYQLNPSHDSYHHLHRVVRNVTAVTGACMMIKKKIFEEAGGLDENLSVTYNDIDFCLRVSSLGYSIIYTPFSQLYHYEGATRGNLEPTEDERYFLNKWKNKIFQRDPFYNQNLSLFGMDYSISTSVHENPAISVLMEAFYQRPDLQKDYPEADLGDFSMLIRWAANFGVKEHPQLKAYAWWYSAAANA